MEINLEMSKKLNIKAAQGQDPEVKLLEYKAKRKAAFERYLDMTVYCWTHGLRVTKRHSGQTCYTAATGHQRMATQQNIMRGSDVGQ